MDSPSSHSNGGAQGPPENFSTPQRSQSDSNLVNEASRSREKPSMDFKSRLNSDNRSLLSQNSANGSFITPSESGSRLVRLPKAPSFSHVRVNSPRVAANLTPRSTPRATDPLDEEEMHENPLDFLDDIKNDLSLKFGFQDDSLSNTKEYFKSYILSRSSQYIKTAIEVSSEMLDDESVISGATGFNEVKYNGDHTPRTLTRAVRSIHSDYISDMVRPEKLARSEAERRWKKKFKEMTIWTKTHQLFLYFQLNIEAANVRLMPELIWFMFWLADEFCDVEHPENVRIVEKGWYLNKVIKPIYDFHVSELYTIDPANGKFLKKEADHAHTVGYDDINETFWDKASMNKIVLKDGRRLLDLPSPERWPAMSQVDWKKSCKKTFMERRTIINHLLCNFSRFWALLFGTFYMFVASIFVPIAYKYRNGPLSPYLSPNQISLFPTASSTLVLNVVSIGGFVAVMIVLFGVFSEIFYVPLTGRNISIVFRRVALLCVLALLCIGPNAAAAYFIWTGQSLQSFYTSGLTAIGTVFNFIGFFTAIFVPPAAYTSGKIYNQDFVGNITPMPKKQRVLLGCFWVGLFTAKFLETYFFIFFPVVKAFDSLIGMNIDGCLTNQYFNPCFVVKWFTVVTFVFLLMTFYYLDTYCWWLVFSAFLQFTYSKFNLFKLVIWDKVFIRLPATLFKRIFAHTEMPPVVNRQPLYAELWNAIIENLKEDHLINSEMEKQLKFTRIARFHRTGSNDTYDGASFVSDVKSERFLGSQISSMSVANNNWVDSGLGEFGNRLYVEPHYLTALENGATKLEFFPADSEAERRLKYFAHTMDMEFPTPSSVRKMPSFSVLIPHYAEKIIYAWKDLTTKTDGAAVPLLQYLAALYPDEWDYFREDCESFMHPDETKRASMDSEREVVEPLNPTHAHSFPEETILPARIWASRRQQSLFRTISGCYKYYEALATLYRLETAEEMASLSEAEREAEIDRVVSEKFNLVISMQRYCEFSKAEKEDTRILLRMFPKLVISYPERIRKQDPPMDITLSHMIDGYCPIDENGDRVPKYTVELPGWPIVGDGKGCNQTHGIYWSRGEFLQVLDANQDHYFEECLKVRSVLNEFKPNSNEPMVGLVGLREHIFSHGDGAIADFSATTETTLVSLNQPTLNKLGARLHYGHPDFWNMSFAMPRGGVSKCQKALHVNEDIYAGMMVFMRGGQNKHVEWMQVGKGKDLGVDSVMGYFSKLASGMCEQTISREQYRLGTCLSFDRLLSFFFANPGFLVNHITAMMSLQLFVLFLVCLAALSNSFVFCPEWQLFDNGEYNTTQQVLFPAPDNCVSLEEVYKWERYIVLTFIPVVWIIWLPVIFHTVLERGYKAALRFLHQIISMSLLFAVFSTQIWARSFLNTSMFGNAKHIWTGRAVEIARKPFSQIYGTYFELSLTIGLLLTGGLLYATVSRGATTALIFFWIFVPPLFYSPFLFNPHMFRFSDFMLDYIQLWKWFDHGNRHGQNPKVDGWITLHRRSRTKYSGYIKDTNKNAVGKTGELKRRAFRSVIWFREIFFPLFMAVVVLLIYSVGSGFGIKQSALLLGLTLVPLVINAVTLMFVGVFAILFGSVFSVWNSVQGIAPITIFIARAMSLLGFLVVFAGVWALSDWTFSNALLGLLSCCLLNRAIVRMIILTFPREVDSNSANLAFWDGRWSRLGVRSLWAPVREYCCKVVEMSVFPYDVFQTHMILFILFPLTLVKNIDDMHVSMVTWITAKFVPPPLAKKERQARLFKIGLATAVFFPILLLFLVFCFGPLIYRPPSIQLSLPNGTFFNFLQGRV